MNSKIRVTKAQLVEIANSEFKKESIYKSYLQISSVEQFGNGFLFQIIINPDTPENTEDMQGIFQSQEFATRLSEKYVLID